ncbi:hypothetical protein SSS_02097 [Sarcoptes scabiei]|uniref:PAZ domain-containing protein n=1 Tax=Sarcoptes scabiei TaxID=52283 RepID=A0A834R6H9_SARSC|nr:hypothetical protein SSS_02097 [Sarcoptes scabiei]
MGNYEKSATFYLHVIEFYGNFDASMMNSDQQSQFQPKFLFATNDRSSLMNRTKQSVSYLIESFLSMDLDQSQIKSIDQFHSHVLSYIVFPLNDFEPIDFDPNKAIKIVPLSKRLHQYEIDFILINNLIKWLEDIKKPFLSNESNSGINRLQIKDLQPYDMDLSQEFTIVSGAHHRTSRLYYILNISDHRPSDMMIEPSESQPNGVTYNQYYLNKYGITIQDQQTNLIGCKKINSCRFNYQLYAQKLIALRKKPRISFQSSFCVSIH